MPNNTSNKLQFTAFDDGKTFKLIKSYLSSEESELDFNKLIPLTEKWTLSSATEKWGTKWNAYSIKVLEHEYTLTYFFETAWSYPMPIIELIFEKFKSSCSITFDSACEGGFFALHMSIYEESEEIEKTEWTSALGNDEDFKIRNAFKSALNI